jgi:hypothetical protein
MGCGWNWLMIGMWMELAHDGVGAVLNVRVLLLLHQTQYSHIHSLWDELLSIFLFRGLFIFEHTSEVKQEDKISLCG